MRGRFAYLRASAATSISFFIARVNPQIIGFDTAFEICTTESKSPGLDIGNPPSIISTPSSSKAFAISIFSTIFN